MTYRLHQVESVMVSQAMVCVLSLVATSSSMAAEIAALPCVWDVVD